MSRPGASPPRLGATLRLGQREVESCHGPFVLHLFRDLVEGRTAMMLVRGEIERPGPLLLRVHSSCVTSECLMGCDCDCAEQLEGALARIAEAGRGVVVYLMQEGRGAGLSAKARDRMLVQASGSRITTFDAYAEMGLPADLRRYDAVPSMLASLGVRGPLRLLTNNPEKRAVLGRALEGGKLEIEGIEPVTGRRSAFNRDYLRAKRGSGHFLGRCDGEPGARPPVRVTVLEPVAHAGDASRLVTARYAIPVALPRAGQAAATDEDGAIHWFWLEVIVDGASGRESVVFTRCDSDSPAASRLAPENEWIRMGLLDRLPLALRAGRAALARALAALAAGEREDVAVAFDEGSLEPAAAARSGLETAPAVPPAAARTIRGA